ncbi:hypothetical protein KAU19_02475 [Candidatus Parcubacteria bacterium]|nr:hypothetical protein [Candidatus Parcubacteria bacterium]
MTILYFITGSCGTGKSSIIPYLKNKLTNFDIHDFDEHNTSQNPTAEWRQQTTNQWINTALKNAENNISTIIAGLSIPKEIKQSEYNNLSIKFCLLDINIDEREKRLRERKATQELIDDIEELIGLRNWVPNSGFNYTVIDTSNLTIEQAGNKVINWIMEIEKSLSKSK